MLTTNDMGEGVRQCKKLQKKMLTHFIDPTYLNYFFFYTTEILKVKSEVLLININQSRFEGMHYV